MRRGTHIMRRSAKLICTMQRFTADLGTRLDDVQAVQWYTAAARCGHSRAHYLLGVCRERGEGVAQDAAEAARSYLRAALLGDENAQYNLGQFYDRGTGVIADSAMAIEFWEKAAAQGHVGAQCQARECGRLALLLRALQSSALVTFHSCAYYSLYKRSTNMMLTKC